MKKYLLLSFVVISHSVLSKVVKYETKSNTYITNITTAQLRALGSANTKEDSYIVTDDGKEGTYWRKRVVQGTSTILDNRGTILVTSDFWIYDNIFTSPENVKWFGVTGDGTTDDIVNINKAARAAEVGRNDMFFPAGSYRVSDSFLPPKNVWCYGMGQFSSIVATSSLTAQSQKPIILCDDDSQVPFKIRDLSIDGATTTPGGNSLIGLQVGSSRNSTFTNITIKNCWYKSVLLRGKSVTGQDIENPVFNLLYTASCGGILIKADGSLNRGNITDASFKNCNITTDVSPTYSTPRIPIEFEGASGKAIYGVNFSECFTQPRNAPVITMIGNGGIVINNNFKNITSDTWGQTSLLDYSELINSIILNGVNQNTFDKIVLAPKNAGVKIINSSNNIFRNFRFQTYTTLSNSRFFDIDALSLENVIDSPIIDQGNFFQNVGGPFSNSEHTLFGDSDFADGRKIIFKDLGYSTFISNSVFKHSLSLLNSPSKLFSTTNNVFTNYAGTFNKKGVTCTLVGKKLNITLPSSLTTNTFNIPIVTSQKYGSVRMRYKFLTTGFSGTIGTHLGGIGLSLIADGNTHDIVFITNAQYLNFPYYGLQLTGTLNKAVTIEIEKWEIFEGYNLPYIPNYVATEKN